MPAEKDPTVDLIFGQNTELDKRVEQSAMMYGGEKDSAISEIPPESLQTASDLLVDLYTHSKKKLARNEELDGFEMVAGGMAQQLESGGRLRPEDANQLYAVMMELGDRMYDPEFAAEMGYKGIAQKERDPNSKEEVDDRWLEEVEKISKVKADVFRSMTGYDGAQSVGAYDHDKVQWEMATDGNSRVIAYLTRSAFDESKTKAEYGRRVQSARLQEYAEKKARYLPEQLLAAELVKEQQKKLDDLRRFVSEKTQQGDARFNDTVTEAVNKATTWQEAEQAVAKLQNAEVATKASELKNRRTASEIREELFFKPGVNATVERVLARKAVEEPEKLEKQKAVAEKRLGHLRSQKNPTKAEQQELSRLEHQVGVINAAERTFEPGGMSEFLAPTDEVTLSTMEDRLPQSAHADFEDYVAERVGYNARPADPKRHAEWRKGLNTKVTSQGKSKATKYKMGSLFAGFLQIELKKVSNA